MPCVAGRSKHILCKKDCEPDCLCCRDQTATYQCRPAFCESFNSNAVKGVIGDSGSTDWIYLHFWRNQSAIGNNYMNPSWGAAGTSLATLASNGFGDSVSTPAARTPNPRFVSNAVSAISGPDPHPTLSMMMVWWGQYIDHTVAITPEGTEDLSFTSAADVGVDPNETIFSATIPFARAKFIDGTSPREHITELTAFIDADNVYGKDAERELALRLMDGSGRLRTSAGNLPPFNTFGLENANATGLPEEDLFLVGDV